MSTTNSPTLDLVIELCAEGDVEGVVLFVEEEEEGAKLFQLFLGEEANSK